MSEAGDRVGFVESHPDDELFAGVGVFGSSQFRDEFVERGEAEGERLGGVDGTSHCDFYLGSKVRDENRGLMQLGRGQLCMALTKWKSDGGWRRAIKAGGHHELSLKSESRKSSCVALSLTIHVRR